MRELTVAALQADMSALGPRCNCLADDYIADAGYVFENHVKPFAEISLRLAARACEQNCGLIVTGEDLCGLSRFIIDTSPRNIFPALTEASAPWIEARLSELAEKYAVTICGCYYKRRGDGIYNTASVFDRRGNLAGAYEKTHLPPDELWQVCPGSALDVLELEFGRVGVEICYDMMFPEVTAVLAMNGAELILHPTAGYGWYDAIGEATLRTRANDASAFIVTAKNYVWNAAGNSSVIDPWGHILANAGFRENAVVSARIDLDEQKTQPAWFNPTNMSGEANVKRRRLTERRPDLYGAVCAPAACKRWPPSYQEQQRLFEMVKNGACRWG